MAELVLYLQVDVLWKIGAKIYHKKVQYSYLNIPPLCPDKVTNVLTVPSGSGHGQGPQPGEQHSQR